MSRGCQQQFDRFIGGNNLDSSYKLYFHYQTTARYIDLSLERPYLLRVASPSGYNNPAIQMNLIKNSTHRLMSDAVQYNLKSNSNVYLVLDYSKAPVFKTASNPTRKDKKVTASVSIRYDNSQLAMFFSVPNGKTYYVHVDQTKSPWSLTPVSDSEMYWRRHLEFKQYIRCIGNPTSGLLHNPLHIGSHRGLHSRALASNMAMDQTDGDHTHPEVEELSSLSEHFDGMEPESDSGSVERESDPDCVEQESDSDNIQVHVDTRDSNDLSTVEDLVDEGCKLTVTKRLGHTDRLGGVWSTDNCTHLPQVEMENDLQTDSD